MKQIAASCVSILFLIASGCSASSEQAASSAGENAVRQELVKVRTDDNVTLHGVVWTPAGGQATTGIVLAQGTSGEFYSNMLVWLGDELAEAGYLVVSLNRRDHGSSFGYQTVEAAAMDHRYAIDLAAERGVEKVVTAGRSFGTVTSPYYVRATDDERVKAMILLAPVGDYRVGTRGAVGSLEKYEEMVAEARQGVSEGKGSDSFWIPPMPGGRRPAASSYESFLDKRGPDSEAVPAEILKDVGDRPILAIRDPADPLPGTLPPAQELLEAANPNLEYLLLPDTRNGEMARESHTFTGREDEVMGIILDWLAKQGLLP
jgi:pimeloyl-ACP methyl ester carboxylesterase